MSEWGGGVSVGRVPFSRCSVLISKVSVQPQSDRKLKPPARFQYPRTRLPTVQVADFPSGQCAGDPLPVIVLAHALEDGVTAAPVEKGTRRDCLLTENVSPSHESGSSFVRFSMHQAPPVP